MQRSIDINDYTDKQACLYLVISKPLNALVPEYKPAGTVTESYRGQMIMFWTSLIRLDGTKVENKNVTVFLLHLVGHDLTPECFSQQNGW